jgi:hypothetical protein
MLTNINQNQLIPFHIEKGLNTSYITSLFMALFYKYDTNINSILIDKPHKPAGFYLQELIRTLFVEPIRKNFSIKSDIINEIRNYLLINNWESDLNYLENRNCVDLYKFLSDILFVNDIEFEIFHIKDGIINETETTLKFKTIDINILINEPTSIKKLFIGWLHENILINSNSYILDCYKLKSIPTFLVFNINRTDETKNTEIDIKKKIKFFNNSDSKQNYLQWRIHSIICKSNQKYYSIFLSNDNLWIEFDEDKFPCCSYVFMDDEDIIEKTKQDVEMIIYTLNN